MGVIKGIVSTLFALGMLYFDFTFLGSVFAGLTSAVGLGAVVGYAILFIVMLLVTLVALVFAVAIFAAGWWD